MKSAPHETLVSVFREGTDVGERYDGFQGVRSDDDGDTYD